MMEETNSYLLLLLFISSLLFCFPGSTTCQAPAPALDLTVEQICQNTSNPSLCISTLTPFPSEMDSPKVIVAMAVNAILNATQVALAEATRLLSDPSTPSLYNSSLQECHRYYNSAIEESRFVVDYIGHGNENGIFSWLEWSHYPFILCEFEYVKMDLSARDAGQYDAFVSWLPEDFLPFKISDMVDNGLDIVKLFYPPPPDF